MDPPIFLVCSTDPTVSALIGGGIDCRIYSFDEAPEGVLKPYVVWNLIDGSPENYLAGRPDADGFTLQVDVYASSADSVMKVTRALRDALELSANITHWGASGTDPTTKDYHRSFDIDWITLR
ncbi:DUF3168 domain-containing protein [Pseudomonas sp. TSRC2-2]|uniref:DUF3168 domain-containing protein n=1 Tax=unclassified Pseudomonas TaxID=196821 RepID=UPI003CF0A227